MPSRSNPRYRAASASSAVSKIRLGFGALALVAIGWQFGIHWRLGYAVVNFWSYFTNLSNAFAAIVLVAGGARALLRRSWAFPGGVSRFVSAVNMAVVGIVFAVLLRDVELGSLLPWINTVLHVVMPVVAILDWLLAPPGVRVGARQVAGATILPALYLIYVLVRGSMTGWYPYPFLDPANVGGYGGVVPYAIAIAVAFLVAGGILAMLGNRPSAHQAAE